MTLKSVAGKVTEVSSPQFDWALRRDIGLVLKKLQEQKIDWLVSP